MPFFILGVIALVIVILLVRWFMRAPPANAARGVRRIGGPLSFLLALIAGLSGRFGIAMALASLGIWLASQSKQAQGWGNAGQRSKATTSTVETEWLDMALDHDSGALDGVVKQGAHRGQRLSELSFDEVVALHRVCAAQEPGSAQILEAYLDHAFPDWRSGAASGGSAGGSGGGSQDGTRDGSSGVMTTDEAYEILGLTPGASDEAIRRAHRTLMLKVHPDRGGSPFLAAQINAAKDRLLGS